MDRPRDGRPQASPVSRHPSDETEGSFSPDTKWIAYSSDESGRREVYVQGFVPEHNPAAGIGKWQISNAGGAKPRWRRDGREMSRRTRLSGSQPPRPGPRDPAPDTLSLKQLQQSLRRRIGLGHRGNRRLLENLSFRQVGRFSRHIGVADTPFGG